MEAPHTPNADPDPASRGALIPPGIGITRLITYWTGERRERAGR